MEKIKSLAGAGKVFSGGRLLGEGDYQIDVYQEFLQGQTLSNGQYRIPGMKRIVGTVQGGPFPIGSNLKLVTIDGATLPFFISNSNGRIEASGPFLTKDGQPFV